MRRGCSDETYRLPVAMVTSSRSPSENGSVISNESGKPSSGRRSPQNVMAQQKVTKEEARKRNGETLSLPSASPEPVPPSRALRRAHVHTRQAALTLSFFCCVPQRPRISFLPTRWGMALPRSLNYSVSCPLPSVLMELSRALEKLYAE